MKTMVYIYVLLILFNVAAFAQLDSEWTRTFGGSSADGGRAVSETNDGGFIIAGYTYSFGAGYADIFLIKTYPNGTEEWTATFGGTGWEYGNSVIQTSDNGYLVTGYTSSFGAGSKDVYLIKTDSAGTESWSYTFGGEGVDVGMSVIESANGGYIICGYTESFGSGKSDVYLIRTDSDGEEIWSYTYGGNSSDMGTSIKELADGTLVIIGSTDSFGSANRDAYLIMTDSSGGQLENIAYTAGADNYEDAYSFCQTRDMGYVIIGSGDVLYSELYDVYLVKTYPDGSPRWARKLGQGTFYDYGMSVCETNDGGILACGTTKSNVTFDNDLYLIKTTADGQGLWIQTVGGEQSEWANAMCKTVDRDYIVIGQTGSSGAGSFDVWLVKFAGEPVSVEESGTGFAKTNLNLGSMPNPFNARTTISYSLLERADVRIEIYDILGQLIATLVDDNQPAGKYEAVWNADKVASGVYFYKIAAGAITETNKMVLLK